MSRPYGQRGKVEIGPRKRDPEGRALCRWCGKPVPRGRRSWCGQQCVDEWRERGDWNHIRNRIIERDKVCQMCGGQRASRGQTYRYTQRWVFGRHYEQVWGDYSALRWGWEVDHVVAVQDGGTDDPSNLRLLCCRCHKERTAKQRRDKALARRRQLQLLDRQEGSDG